jgi:hypothetical protein
MKVRIEGGELPHTVRVVNAETGERIRNVRSVRYRVSPGQVPRATLEVLLTPVDLVADAEFETCVDLCGTRFQLVECTSAPPPPREAQPPARGPAGCEVASIDPALVPADAVIVVRCPDSITPACEEHIKAVVDGAFPHRKILILDGGISLDVKVPQ